MPKAAAKPSTSTGFGVSDDENDNCGDLSPYILGGESQHFGESQCFGDSEVEEINDDEDQAETDCGSEADEDRLSVLALKASPKLQRKKAVS
jgi:hypothetical protein